MSTVSYSRNIDYITDQMLGFIDFSSEGIVTEGYKTASVTSSYSYTNNTDTSKWLLFWHSTESSGNNLSKNFNLAPIYMKDSGNQYRYASSDTSKAGERNLICVNVQPDVNVTWNCARPYVKKFDTETGSDPKKQIQYHVYDELEGRRIGFIGNKFSTGTLTQLKSSSTDDNEVLTIPQDCWFYSDTCHYGIMFSNEKVGTTTPNWSLPLLLRENEFDGDLDKNRVQLLDDGFTTTTTTAIHNYSMLIPLKKGQRVSIARARSSLSGKNISYSLYSMEYSWNSFITGIDFNNVLFAPTSTLVRPKGEYFTYTANEDCWAYVCGSDKDKWLINNDDTVVLYASDTTNAANIRHGRFIPLRRGQQLKLKYKSKLSKAKLQDWSSSNSIILAVYGMKPAIKPKE